VSSTPLLQITVLVIDDNAHMRSILKELLRAIGVLDVKEAADPVEAFELIKSIPIDLVLVDFSMPIIDGVEFTQMVRTSSDSPNPFMPIVMKPVTAKSLMDRINVVVNNPRSFVKGGTYFGPDRRRRKDAKFSGPWRRKDDGKGKN
jgi:two-component system, chemotaxis family, chemotaxis protein CheY